jgi:hypothetical protein
VPDAAGEAALEAADGLAGALAFLAFAVEAMAVHLGGADRDRRHAGGAGELGLAAEALGAGDLADELGRGQGPETGLGEQVRRDLGDEVGDLGLERV